MLPDWSAPGLLPAVCGCRDARGGLVGGGDMLLKFIKLSEWHGANAPDGQQVIYFDGNPERAFDMRRDDGGNQWF